MKKRYCQYCQKDITDLWPAYKSVCPDPVCQEKQYQYKLQYRRDYYKKEKAANRKKRGNRTCAICGKVIEHEQDVRRAWCLNPECEKQYKKEQYKRKIEKQKEWYHKTKLETVEDKPVDKGEPIPKEEFFSQAIYEKEQRELRKYNGWKCQVCGRKLRGNNRFFCQYHQERIKKMSDRLDGNYALESADSTYWEAHGAGVV